MIKEQREDLFITCVEGGCNYWAIFQNVKTNGEPFSTTLFQIIINGGKIDIFDAEDSSEHLGFVTRKMIDYGEKLMALKEPEHFKDIVKEQWDATTADVWLQFIVFGKIVYG